MEGLARVKAGELLMVSGRVCYIVGHGRATREPYSDRTGKIESGVHLRSYNYRLPPPTGFPPDPRSPSTLTKIRLYAFDGLSSQLQEKRLLGRDLPPSQLFPDTPSRFVRSTTLALIQI